MRNSKHFVVHNIDVEIKEAGSSQGVPSISWMQSSPILLTFLLLTNFSKDGYKKEERGKDIKVVFSYLKGRGERQRDYLPSTYTIHNDYNIQGWAKLKPAASNYIWVAHVDSRDHVLG